MRIRDWLSVWVAVLLVTGCAGMPGGASSETRSALAPTGKLRVAFFAAPIYAIKDPTTGEMKGVAVDLGRELARRLGVPFDPVVYSALPALTGGANSGEWDVALVGINPERAAVMDFSAPYMEIEQGYLVRAGLPAATIADVDRAGIRVGVLGKASADSHLSRTLKNATLVRAATIGEVYAMVGSGKADVIAASKAGLYTVAAKESGSRVLDGRIFVEPIGFAVPKGRNAAAAEYVGKFVEIAKAEGLVKSAIDNAGLRGAVVGPPK